MVLLFRFVGVFFVCLFFLSSSGMWLLATFVSDSSSLFSGAHVSAGQESCLVAFVVDHSGSVNLSEVAVTLSNGNTSSPGTTCVTSQPAARAG